MSGLKIILLTLFLAFSFSIASNQNGVYEGLLEIKPPLNQKSSSPTPEQNITLKEMVDMKPPVNWESTDLKSENAQASLRERHSLALMENNATTIRMVAYMYGFSLLVIMALTYMTPMHEAKDIITLVGLVTVIFMSIILILVASNSELLVAPMGILGAIAGYLFGSKRREPEVQE